MTLHVRDLAVEWRTPGQAVLAVRDIALDLGAGEGLALVGASGAGKSTIALALLGLLPGNASRHGTIRIAGRPALAFQDAGTALNPVMRVGRQVAERVGWTPARRALLDAGIPDPDSVARRFPHELSGGQRQRVMLAVALAQDPALLVADEPTTGLDPTVRRALLGRLAALRAERGLALLLITHDLAAARHAVEHVAVLDAGRIVEQRPLADLLAGPTSAMGQALVAAMPRLPEPA